MQYRARLLSPLGKVWQKDWFAMPFSRSRPCASKPIRKVAQYANLIIAVSTTDADYLRKQFPNQRIEFVPCFHENNRITAKPGKSDYILYHGKLSVIENERAVLFLTKHVFSQLKHTCIIAGMNPTRLIREAAAPYPHIKVEANPQ